MNNQVARWRQVSTSKKQECSRCKFIFEEIHTGLGFTSKQLPKSCPKCREIELAVKHGITEKMIVGLLRVRHKDEFFISQCKDGPGHENHRRRRVAIMDGFAISNSWTSKKPYTCYEIKTSRSDFLSDKKWEKKYLPLCDRFYFVCPDGMIKPEELPDEAGLIYVFKNGKGLRKIKESVKDPADKQRLEHVFRYILTWRYK